MKKSHKSRTKVAQKLHGSRTKAVFGFKTMNLEVKICINKR